MTTGLKHTQERALQYWFVDGLVELAAGLISLFLAVLLWLWPIFLLWRWSLPVVFGAGLAVSLGLRLIIQRVKERSTYPKTGYAAPLTGLESKRSILIAVAFTLIFLVSNYLISTRGSQALLWSPALAGVAFAFVFAWTGALTRLRRLYVLALVSLCLGVVLSILGMDYLRGVGILAGIVGLILLVQGHRTRQAYLSQNPAPGNPADG